MFSPRANWRQMRYEQKGSGFMRQARLLLVEDNQTLCEVLTRNLRARGYQLMVAHDVAGALEALRVRDFDLILLDINLPDQTGWDLLRAVKNSPDIHLCLTADGRLPVVVLSAVRVTIARLEEFRPFAYLSKPFPLEALLRLAAQATTLSSSRANSYWSSS